MNSAEDIAAQVQAVIEQVTKVVVAYGFNVLGAIVILIIGWLAANWIRSAITRALSKIKRIDEMLVGFFASLAKYAVIAFTVVAVLNRFGVETTSFVAVLGAAGLAIGLALQGTLSNVAAGVMLLLFRPFKVGDFIEGAGHSGTIKATGLFTTEMATGDNIHIVVPNSQLWGAAIRNFNHHPKRRVDMLIGIGYSDDVDKAIAIIKRLAGEDARVHKDPEPFVEVANLGESAVELAVRMWADTPDYWAVKFAMNKAIKKTFDHEGVSFPFPQRDVHVYHHGQDRAFGE